MESDDYTYTLAMSDREIEDALREGEVGVLSLATDGDAYAIPVAYHYADRTVFFRLGEHDGSEKMQFVESTDEACFVHYDYESEMESTSIMVRGPLTRVPDAEAPDRVDIDDAYVSLRVFGEPIEELEPRLYRLDVAEWSGRKTAE
ncbi:pyridoxamine 5'-phosphate oxidase family protein [Halobium salinum]|uniref:Pyridoxamine 5'-phosphate oxidase family protein n=1 Tax=Halobium salinum TaxID=1364940 RepID=A0ABD5PA51_9EURY|nr:pyridoxamine 5'-phosphate oxidase family protein [Halobium salinum]